MIKLILIKFYENQTSSIDEENTEIEVKLCINLLACHLNDLRHCTQTDQYNKNLVSDQVTKRDQPYGDREINFNVEYE